MKPSIRITASGEVFEVLSERPVAGGDLLEVEIRSSQYQNIYRAIVSQIQTPSPDVCSFLIEHLPNIGEFEEYEILDMADAIMRGNRKAYAINAIADIVPYLVRVGLISYEKKPTPEHGDRFFFKRSATTDVIRRTLSSPPPPPPLAEVKNKAEEVKEEPEPKKPKKKKKKKTLVADGSPLPKKKKKKKKRKPCCDDPRIVRSKSTGKRRCKNCGTKLPPKKKKD